MIGGYFRPQGWVQRHWDARAAANFIFGGTGTGLIVSSALVAAHAGAFTTGPKIGLGLGLALIALGLGAVWLEIGRKLRAVNVFFNPRTSWMTRESYAAVVVFALGIAALATGDARLALACALATLVFLWCQGRILRASKGIPAWRAPEVGALIIATGLAEGAGLAAIGATLLQAGYLEKWDYHPTLSGTPQGGIISPLLSNIYLDRLDQFVEHVLIPRFTRGQRRERSREYAAVQARMPATAQ